MLKVKLLGSFEVKRDGKPVTIHSRPAQSLFAYLVLNAGTLHRREKLAGLLWPESNEESARDYLRHGLWRIRKAIGPFSVRNKEAPYLITDDIHISFNVDSSYSLDAAVIEKINANEASVDELIEALSLFEGELLPGFYDEWVVLEREHMLSIFEQKMDGLLQRLKDETRWQDILIWGEKWISLGQKPEPAYRALMSASAAMGDVSKMAATYARCRKSLGEYGFEPSEQTRHLYENLKSGKQFPRDNIGTTKTDAAKRMISSNNIPNPLTSFIGREKEMKEIATLLSMNRLLTLTGSGGVGKTRLAIQTANAFIRKFKGGVSWVDLVGLADGDLIPQEIVRVLNLQEVPQEPVITTLEIFLKSKELLIVLDNCEHIIESSTKWAEHLLAACPKLKILATSRERLGLFNEAVWHVPSLGENTSINLFAERARVAQHDFSLTDSSRNFVGQICVRLDGIPLAIELAASRVAILSVEEIARRLDDRFVLLTSGSRTALPRHQTLRGTIDWSHELLTSPERILFRRLALFAGGFTLEAAEKVCAGEDLRQNIIIDMLGRLVDKSLVIPEPPSKTLGTRYRVLETIRQYALEKLEENDNTFTLRDNHLEFYMHFAEEAEQYLDRGEQATWVDRLEAEIDNIRAAIVWCTPNHVASNDQVHPSRLENGLRLVGALIFF
jgi:predicted ATPase/DNA-binding SARP family transcriptional activator